MKKEFFNPELNRTDLYTEVWLPEKVTVKDEKDLLVENHYWRDSTGELWSDFRNPMENVYRGFEAYRRRKKYMLPEQIRALRESLNLSVRNFANALGISPSALTQIENNHRIQTKYQERLFESVSKNPTEFLKSIKKKAKNINTKYKINSVSCYKLDRYNHKFVISDKLGDAV